jgi:biopolymer transport protein ExbB/TolQ
MFAAMWCWSMLWMKKRKLAVQKRLLHALEQCKDDTERQIFIAENVEQPSDFAAAGFFLLKKKLEYRNLPAAETDTILAGAAAEYEKASDTSFIFASTLIWAVPVLGFIGTVLGLAKAVSKFGLLASSGTAIDFNAVLPQVTGGLATAFETTLIALVLALILQIFASFRRQAEEEFFGSLKSKLSSEKEDASGE